jgi:hypothetical protein
VASTVADRLGGTNLIWSYDTASGRSPTRWSNATPPMGADAIVIGRPRRRHPYRLRTSIAHRLLSCADRIVIVVP